MFGLRLALARPARLPLRSIHTSLRACNSEAGSSASSDLGFQVNPSRTRDLPALDAEPSASSSQPRRTGDRARRGNERNAPTSYREKRKKMAEELRSQGMSDDQVNAHLAEAGLPPWRSLTQEQKEVQLSAAGANAGEEPSSKRSRPRPPRNTSTTRTSSVQSTPSSISPTKEVVADASSSQDRNVQDNVGPVEPSRRAKSSVEAVDLSFLAPAQHEAAIGENRRAVKAKENNKKPKTPREKRPQRAREVQPAPAADHSMAGLFGVQSLISPAVRGARDPERSYWAAGLEPAAARKADILRLAGSYTTLLPTAPLGSKSDSPAEQARHTAAWVLSLNPDVSMRGAKAAEGILGQYLK